MRCVADITKFSTATHNKCNVDTMSGILTMKVGDTR